MPDLVPVHGGLESPVSRVIPLSRRRQFLAEAANLPKIEVNRADLSTVYRIADGTLSPLEGPMDEHTWHYVLDHDSIDFGFRHYAWTAPISLPVTDRGVGESAPRPERGTGLRRQPGGAAQRQQRLRLGQAEARRVVLRHVAHRPPGRPHGHGRSAHPPGRRRSVGAAAADRSGVRTVRALAAADAHPDRRASLGARPGVSDPQPAAPRPRVRAGCRRRATDPRRASSPARCSTR